VWNGQIENTREKIQNKEKELVIGCQRYKMEAMLWHQVVLDLDARFSSSCLHVCCPWHSW
jgi:hypothetical protein